MDMTPCALVDESPSYGQGGSSPHWYWLYCLSRALTQLDKTVDQADNSGAFAAAFDRLVMTHPQPSDARAVTGHRLGSAGTQSLNCFDLYTHPKRFKSNHLNRPTFRIDALPSDSREGVSQSVTVGTHTRTIQNRVCIVRPFRVSRNATDKQ
ncbi:hypothetical protein CROQUDRAFT_97525 [Cronartium quercuum f. sp. fusiforme G11]|uniref:Uncharacterized protein n=1 Tax=Cronartium quercuum f. sp. fusiforme G11 TaxID=708437 RepID=A0A9P6NEW0_9BASI|nr:hypothetical protein CROQUDRAFT_97525 [Cronartium quercuum f. sp. fusiforme G11]